jgi:hypothetical protein
MVNIMPLLLLAAALLGISTPSVPVALVALAEEPTPPSAPPPAGADDGDDPSTLSRIPPGTPEDQALWRTTVEVDRLVPLAKRKMAELQWTLRNERLDERLGTLAEGTSPDAARAREVRGRVAKIAVESYAILTRPWPIDTTRVCSYQLLSFGTAMSATNGPEKSYYLEAARADLQQCVAKARTTLEFVDRLNRELGESVAEALELTGPLPRGAVPPPPPSRPTPGTPSVPMPPPAQAPADRPAGERSR